MISALRTESDSRIYWMAIGTLIISAWLALAWFGASPYGDHVRLHRPARPGHESFASMEPQHLFHVTLPRPAESALPASAHLGLFVGGWVLMTIAMMLPTSLPLVTLFRAVVRRRPDGAVLLVSLIAGYLAIWVAFGVAVYLLESALDAVIARIPLLATNAAYLGAGVLALAGIYQFTPLKERCLEACRSPMSFVAEHWHGGPGRAAAARLGLRHGLFCLGCCWTLMLLMFVVGGAHLGWMLALGAVMATEKAAPWGRRLVAPVGAALVLAAAMMALRIAGNPFA